MTSTATFTYSGSIITGVVTPLNYPLDFIVPSTNGPTAITNIGPDAFKDTVTGGIATLSFDPTTTLASIGTNAFQGCYGFINGLSIPNSVIYIGDNAFYDSNFAGGTLTLSSGLTNIGASVFQFCRFNGELNIPDTVIFIGNFAFEDCINLTKIKLSNNTITIGQRAFYGCSGVTGNLTIPDSVSTINFNAFQGCNFNKITLNKTQSMFTNSFKNGSNCVLNVNLSDNINIAFLSDNVVLSSGSLPSGITLNNSLLSGTPTSTGVYTFSLNSPSYVSTLNFTMNIEGEEQVCLLSDCDVLMGNGTYKNISEITVEDETVMGFFSGKPCRIVKLVKNTHDINTLEPTNVPYLIRKSAVSEGVPNKDIHVSGHHRMILKKENCNEFVGVQLFKLNTVTTLDITTTQSTVNYFHIKLEDPMEGLIVNNLPLESLQE